VFELYECDDCIHVKYCESAGAEEFDGKAENCPDFIHKKHQYCADCGKRLTVNEILDSLEVVGVAVCRRDLNRRMDW
jgi:hypothetical protein